MARSPAKVTAPAVAQPEPTAFSFTPSDAARAAGHAAGMDVAGMLATLRLQLIETRCELSTSMWLAQPGDPQLPRLRSLYKRLNLFLGQVDVFDPSGGG